MNTEHILQIKDLHTQFGNKIVHRGVSFEVKKGEILGLLGGSGTGKSVILRSLIGLERPQQGEIIFKNRDIRILDEDHLKDVRRDIAYVFQNGALFDSLTVEENLAYPLEAHEKMTPEERQERIKKMLELIQMPDAGKLHPSSLSGGMQKRVGLARAVIRNPSIILYDEPTAGLDPYNTKNINELILQLKRQGTTGVLVTHDLPSVFQVADRLALLWEGKIIHCDTTEKFRANSNPIIQKFLAGDIG